jgi:hypothetical protein
MFMASNTQTRASRATTSQPMPFAFAEMAMRSAAEMYALQMSTVRAFAETQARAASAWGLPNVSAWFLNGSEESVGQATLESAGQIMSTLRRTAESVAQLQSNVRELLTAQSGAANQELQKFVERMGLQVAESFDNVRTLVDEQSRRVMNETDARVEAIAVAMQQEEEPFRGGSQETAGEEAAATGARGHPREVNGARGKPSQRQH